MRWWCLTGQFEAKKTTQWDFTLFTCLACTLDSHVSLNKAMILKVMWHIKGAIQWFYTWMLSASGVSILSTLFPLKHREKWMSKQGIISQNSLNSEHISLKSRRSQMNQYSLQVFVWLLQTHVISPVLCLKIWQKHLCVYGSYREDTFLKQIKDKIHS